MVTIRYANPNTVGAYRILFGDHDLRFASGVCTEYQDGTPHTLTHSIFDVDEFSDEKGQGEHHCTHVSVDGEITIDPGVSSDDELDYKHYTPISMSKPVWFSACDTRYVRHIFDYPLLYDINDVRVEEGVGLNPKKWGWHSMYSGSITPDYVDVIFVEGLWSDGVYGYRRARHWDLKCISLDIPGGTITYEGKRSTGDFPSDLTPETFGIGHVQWTDDEPFTVTCALVPVSPFDDLDYAIRQIQTEGILAKISSQYVSGLVRLWNLSATSDAMDAIRQARPLNMNNIENGVQAFDLKSIIPPLKGAFKYVACDASGALVVASDLYLWYKYVAKTTCGDARELIKAHKQLCKSALQQIKPGVFRHRTYKNHSGEWESYTAAKVSLHPQATDDLTKILNVLDNVGLLPSLSRFWDLAPYSFVADWALNIQDCLEAIDVTANQYRYNIDYVTSTRKVWLYGYMADLKRIGSMRVSTQGINFRFYNRRVDPTVPIDLAGDFRKLTTPSHIVTGSALLITSLL